MDDPLHATLGLGPDRDDVAAGADGHDRLTDQPGKLGGAEHRVQALANPILRDPQPPSNGGQLGGGRVQDLAAFVDAAADARRKLRRGIELLAQVRQVGLAPAPETLLEASGGHQRVRHFEQLGRRQPATASGSVDRATDVTRTADRGLCLLVEQSRGLVSLVLEQSNVDGVRAGQRRQRELASRLEAGQLGKLLDDRSVLERPQGALVGRDLRVISAGRGAGHR